MRTNMEYLYDALGAHGLHFHLGSEEHANVLRAVLLSGSGPAVSRSLYVIKATQLHASIISGQTVNLAILADSASAIDGDVKKALRSCNYLIANHSVSLEDISRLLADVIAKKESFFERCSDMTQALYAGKGLQAVADTGSLILRSPLAITDNAYMILARSGIEKGLNRFYDHSYDTGYLSEEAIMLIKKARRYVKTQSSEDVFFTPNTSSVVSSTPYGWLDVSVRINNMPVAYISAAGEDHAFTEFDKDCLAHLARVASLELQKNEFFIQNHGIMYETFLYDLLDHRMKDAESIRSRMKVLNIKEQKYYYVIAIHHRPDSESTLIPSGTQILFRNLLRGSISVPYKKGIILLVGSETREMKLPDESEKLSDVLNSHRLDMGISNPFQDLQLADRYYLQACQAIAYGRRINTESCWYFYRDYSVYHAIDLYSREHDLLELCHPAVKELYLSKKDSDRELLETLDAYILYMKNVAQITDNLHIHKSTLFYRIGKIRSLTGSELSDGDEWLQLSFSMKVIRFLDALKHTD